MQVAAVRTGAMTTACQAIKTTSYVHAVAWRQHKALLDVDHLPSSSIDMHLAVHTGGYGQ